MADEQLSAQRFRECLEQTFRLSLGEEHLDAELIEVRDLEGDGRRPDRQPFSILLRGPADLLFDQQMVKVDHETLGEQHLFLVPLGPDQDHEGRGMLFEAVFT